MRTLFRVPLLRASVFLLLLLGFTSSCRQNHSTASYNTSSVPPAQYHFHPTASEAFRLQSECVKLAQKILDDDIHGAAVTDEVRSNYDPDSNRCYVELDTTTYDASKPNYGKPNYVTESRRSLYDGQTDELLAYLIAPRGNEQGSGMVFVNHHRAIDPNVQMASRDNQKSSDNPFTTADNYDTEAFIDRAMGDDVPR